MDLVFLNELQEALRFKPWYSDLFTTTEDGSKHDPDHPISVEEWQERHDDTYAVITRVCGQYHVRVTEIIHVNTERQLLSTLNVWLHVSQEQNRIELKP